MSNKVTLYIGDSYIRLLVMGGERIKKSATLPLEPGLVTDAVVIKEDELAARLKRFMRKNKVKAQKVVVGISGLRNLTRPIELPRLSPSLVNEAVLREAKRVLPLGTEQYYIMWQAIPATAGKINAFVIALRSRNADSVINTVRKAGLTVAALDLKPLALARLVKEKTAIILDAQPTELDIVIISGGVPQPIRTVPLPGEAQTPEEKLLLIKAELDRTIDFFNSNNPDKVLDSRLPVYVSGELASRPELASLLPGELGYAIVPLSSGWKAAQGTDSESYEVNVGLAMLDGAMGSRVSLSAVNTNLLPPVYLPKPVSLLRIAVIPGVAALAVVLVSMFIVNQSTLANVDSLRNQLDTVNRLILQEQTRRNGLKRDLAKAEASCRMFTTVLDKLNSRHLDMNSSLRVALGILPRNIRVIAVDSASGTLTINGTAPDEGVVLAYAANLESSGRDKEVVVSSIKKTENQEIRFRIIYKTAVK